MAQIPGMLGDVYWGDPGKPLPNWREHPRPDGDEDDDDDRELTDEERVHLIGLLGVDSRELAKRYGNASESADEGEDDDDNEEARANEPD